MKQVAFYCSVASLISVCGLLAFPAAFADSSAPAPGAHSDESVGVIESVDPSSTTISVQNASGVIQEKIAGNGLGHDDHVLSKSGQTVVLKLKDGSEITEAPSSDLSVSDYIPGQPASVPHVQQYSGSAFYDVPKASSNTPGTPTKFYIKTKSAVMGVRGTQFIVDQTKEDYSVVHTLDGNVAMAKTESDLGVAGKTVELGSGKTSYLTPAMRAPAPARLFNRQAYLSRVGKAYPSMGARVNRAQNRRVQEKLEENRNKTGRTHPTMAERVQNARRHREKLAEESEARKNEAKKKRRRRKQ